MATEYARGFITNRLTVVIDLEKLFDPVSDRNDDNINGVCDSYDINRSVMESYFIKYT